LFIIIIIIIIVLSFTRIFPAGDAFFKVYVRDFPNNDLHERAHIVLVIGMFRGTVFFLPISDDGFPPLSKTRSFRYLFRPSGFIDIGVTKSQRNTVNKRESREGNRPSITISLFA